MTSDRRPRSPELTMRLLAFQLRHHWFCLPLEIARRVLPTHAPIDTADGDLIQLQNEHIPIIDGATLVYGQAVIHRPPAEAVALSPMESATPVIHTIVVVELSSGESIGLVVDSTPALKRVRQAALSPVPPIYQTGQQLRGLTSVVNPDPEAPDTLSQPMFLLSVEALLSSSDRSPLDRI